MCLAIRAGVARSRDPVDPTVGRHLARAKVRGYQGSDLTSPESVAAVAKHFCAYGPVQNGRRRLPGHLRTHGARPIKKR